ncbi:5'-nucleotidase, lipoprotein e(P4) family [Cytophagales bacterium LB-30]|uniref:5'-nucleotidase, lipoprotein e(P4) family n=1 Tax=Shiella aurantiaca TaxID=3058365 RepID=A0ABT8F5L8_9BACT|nr:5'-nucleotidase, lipoprotein e(P4) family [Shiella aurantiaca]MDN4165777.1 5'-nucleotidase, lipoprotein e(P4) family [Shiella aurantiaca]
MKNLYIISFLSMLAFSACQPQEKAQNTNASQDQEFLEQAVIWHQQAGEYQALCFQAYNQAAWTLQQKVANNKEGLSLAVVLDLDETVLDNSPYSAAGILEDQPYTSETWKTWTDKAQARAIPGAKEFLLLADSLGIQLFYISNRKVNELEATMKNMDSLGMPQVETAHFLLRDAESNKQNRRNKVLENHQIALLIGDNLNDLHEMFEEKGTEERNALVATNRQRFGTDYIVIPNAIYGSWETALYGYEKHLSEAQKDSVRNSVLRTE